MREHRVYYGFLKNDHYFVEVKKDLFDEWNVQDIRYIYHRDIVKWNLKRRESRYKTILMTILYIKQGCGNTVKLLKTVKRATETERIWRGIIKKREEKKKKEYQYVKSRRYNH